jgi:hypothetical protein
MVKRFGISLCVLLAFVMLQVHNFMPHQHHDEAVSYQHKPHHHDSHHHDHDDQDKQDHDDVDHEFPFNHVNHSADFGMIGTGLKDGKDVLMHWLVVPVDFVKQIVILCPPESPPLSYISPYKTLFAPPSFFRATPRRAPPACC